MWTVKIYKEDAKEQWSSSCFQIHPLISKLPMILMFVSQQWVLRCDNFALVH
jgi:hypothetical protein